MTHSHVSMWSIAMDGLSVPQRLLVAEAMTPRAYAKRTLLYSEGKRCGGISVVERGRVRSFHTTPGGKEFTHLVNGQGTLLGLVSVMLNAPAVISVESLDDVTVAQITSNDLLALIEAMPRLSFNFSRILATTYMESLARGRRAIDSAPVRLGKVLCKLAALELGDAGGASGEINGLTQEDLSAMVGTTRSWVAQMLGHFEEIGLLKRRRGAIVIPDLPSLVQHITQLESQTVD